jgi:hypothetical protein
MMVVPVDQWAADMHSSRLIECRPESVSDLLRSDLLEIPHV